jgi:hypothetical protein
LLDAASQKEIEVRLLPIGLVFIVLSANVFPCSIFKYSVEDRTYFCGNEDWTARDPAIQTYKSRGASYAYIIAGWKSYLPHYAQAGVNSEGLCFDWAAVPVQRYSRDDSKQDASLDITVDILRKCRSVDEAIAYIKRYNVAHLAEEHIMFADTTGKSCVIEFNNSRLQVIEGNAESQYITNFHVSDPTLGWHPCDRYDSMEALFREKGNKEGRLVDILDAVHQESQYPTIYSYIFDLRKMEISMFYNHNYSAKRVYQFARLVQKDTLIDISQQGGAPFSPRPDHGPTARLTDGSTRLAGDAVRGEQGPPEGRCVPDARQERSRRRGGW